MNRPNFQSLASCPTLLNKRQIAARYGVSVSCINKWMRKGLPYIRLRYKTVRFNPVICDAALCKPEGNERPLRRRRKPLPPSPPVAVQIEMDFSGPEQLMLWPESVPDQSQAA